MNEKVTTTRGIYERNEEGAYVKVGTDIHTFWYENERIFVEHDGITKSMRVIEYGEYIYKLQKTQIKAIGGAKGLYSYMKTEVEEESPCFVNIICRWIDERGK